MDLEIQFTEQGITHTLPKSPRCGDTGAWIEFRGIVRAREGGRAIVALEYEAYRDMALSEMRRILETLAVQHPCLAATVIHRLGIIPAGETAIYVGVAASHRAEAIALLGGFMDRLKQDVPIWKRRAIESGSESRRPPAPGASSGRSQPPALSASRSLDQAMAEIRARCRPLPAEHTPLAGALGRVLRETIRAPEDWPPCDRSTRDGYAVLAADPVEVLSVVDTLHAADCKPRQLQPGEAVRVATGSTLPCGGLRVVMQEKVERNGDRIRVVDRESATNISFRGEDFRVGAPLLLAGTKMNAGALALLATVGITRVIASPQIRVAHFTTGDELVRPEKTPNPGQIRDASSILIRGLLQGFSCDLAQGHLPEDFDLAKSEVAKWRSQIETANLLLISGGASVGEKDSTRKLLEELGFEVVFGQIDLRPGRPLIFGVDGARVAFGLPGNPLSHFVCFHFAVATALAGLAGTAAPAFFRGKLATRLEDKPHPRETLWPARLEWEDDGVARLRPLAWANSSNVTCLEAANALVRVPAKQGAVEASAGVDFLPVAAMLGL